MVFLAGGELGLADRPDETRRALNSGAAVPPSARALRNTGEVVRVVPRIRPSCGRARRASPRRAGSRDNRDMAGQTISFCRSADGTRIAVASVGSGPPLLRAAHWLTHVEHDFDSPVWRCWLRELSRDRCYIRYDQRGCGLSDAEVSDFSLDAWVADLEAVADHLQLARFPLLGMSQGGAVAIAYALRHPDRVSRLILMGAYARGAARRATDSAARLEADTLVNMVRIGWGRDNPAFRQVFTDLFIPDGTPQQRQWWNEVERLTASAANAARTLAAFHEIDVTELAAQLRVPTLVMHARGDARVPFEEGRRLASLIPGARFVPLDSINHVLLEDEPAWQHFLRELREFLGADGGKPTTLGGAPLTASEREVLRLISQGLDNKTIAAQLGKSEKTVRNQVTSILAKLGVHSRAQAAARVRSLADLS